MELTNTIIICATLITITLVTIYKIGKIYDKKQDIMIREQKIKESTVFSALDPKLIKDEIDNLITDYMNDYMLKNIIAEDIQYIDNNLCNDMIRIVTFNIVKDISEMYIWYIKCIYSVNDDEKLIEIINKLVRDKALEKIIDFNTER